LSEPRRSRPRVLHLIDPPRPLLEPGRAGSGEPVVGEPEALLCRAVMSALDEVEHTALVIGNRDAERWAQAFELPGRDRLCAPSEAIGVACRAVRRFVGLRGPFNAIQAWSDRSARVAAEVARRSRLPVRVAPPPTRALGAERELPRIAHPRAPIDRHRMRAELGIEARDRVIALIAREDRLADAFEARWILGLTSRMGVPATLLVARTHRDVARAIDIHRIASEDCGLVVVDGPVLPILPACDGALCVDPEPGPRETPWARLVLASAAAGGLPCAAKRWAHERLGHPAPLCANHETAPAVAQALSSALESPSAAAPRIAEGPNDVPDGLRARLLASWGVAPTPADDRHPVSASSQEVHA